MSESCSRERPLFILEMANNHMGSVDHGRRIIREFAAVVKDFACRFRFAMKFQYRQLDSFIHPDYRTRTDLKYIKRFLETRFSEEQFRALKQEADAQGFTSVCTPFDEASVDMIVRHGYAFLKIASCSCTDWPLLERAAAAGKPMIVSTAGVALADLDRVVSFLQHRSIPLTLMHCVAEYPTANAHLQLNQLDLLRSRYPGVAVGFSTHESPACRDSVRLAAAKGAVVFEKHVGVATEAWPLNAYSATPAQVREWLAAAAEALDMCGVPGTERAPFTEKELADLAGLRRGVFLQQPLPAGTLVAASHCLLAIPALPGQLTANDLSKYREFRLRRDLPALAPLTRDDVEQHDHREQVYRIVQRVKGLLERGRVVVPGKADFEISHHYGLERFDEYGMTMITVVNREYCKKLLVLLPGQKHPEQYHQHKEETFHVLHGELDLVLGAEKRRCRPGDVIVVERGMRHSFASPGGTVIEEISSTHHRDDSFYTDPAIAANPQRKTRLTYWMDVPPAAESA